MSVWYAIPSAKTGGEWSTLANWKQRGYKVAVFRDTGADVLSPSVADLQEFGKYAGYPAAVNLLCRKILAAFPDTNCIVTGGDDIDPDPAWLPEILEVQFVEHFQGTFGVMQPTGDRWMVNKQGLAATERVLESPWMGREWIQRMYGGKGPICEEYFHFFEDEEHHDVAVLLDKLWNRRDVTQLHHHWSRFHRERPRYLDSGRLNWTAAEMLFRQRKADGFPGYLPVPVAGVNAPNLPPRDSQDASPEPG